VTGWKRLRMEIDDPVHTDWSPVLDSGLVIVSPGADDSEFKDQDRARICPPEANSVARLFAIVCDGLTQSPNAVEAANHVSKNVERLYGPNGVREIANELIEMRVGLLGNPINLDESQPPVLRDLFREIIEAKRRQSYQTTFISVCIERCDSSAPGRMTRLRVLGCGDSAVFVFNGAGDLLYTNLDLASESDVIQHGSSVTAALPDSCMDIVPDFIEFDEEPSVLLCSDGFYDSFTTFHEIHRWLTKNHSQFMEARWEELLQELHLRLRMSKGDDDISFVWLFPRAVTKVGTSFGVPDLMAEPIQALQGQITQWLRGTVDWAVQMMGTRVLMIRLLWKRANRAWTSFRSRIEADYD
jgi:serine/threonine protein phosphatase PrpC